MINKYIRWLYEELPDLVEKGVLPHESALRIREHYGDIKERGGRQIAIIVFGILAALLIGSGTILLFAHNWDDFTRPLKVVLSLVPLIVGQILAGSTIWRSYESIAWREGSSTFLMIAIGACIALISQTYHIPGNFGSFMLTWMLLAIPLVYLLNATAPLILYLAGITCWVGYARFSDEYPIFYWLLAVLIIPYLWRAIKEDRYGIRPVLIMWIFSISLCIATGFSLGKLDFSLCIINYSFLLSIMYFIGILWFDETVNDRKKPLQAVGALGSFILAFTLSYEGIWQELPSTLYWEFQRISKLEMAGEMIFYGLMLVLFIILVVRITRIQNSFKWLFIILPGLVTYGYIFARGYANIILALFLFNFYLIGFGIITLVVGLKEEKIRTVNAGMILLIIVLTARFFDVELSFLTRGLAFIAIGIGFLFVNIVLHRRWKGGAQ